MCYLLSIKCDLYLCLLAIAAVEIRAFVRIVTVFRNSGGGLFLQMPSEVMEVRHRMQIMICLFKQDIRSTCAECSA